MKIKMISVFTIVLSFVAINLSYHAHAEHSDCDSRRHITDMLINRAKACIAASREISAKEDVVSLLDALKKSGFVLQEGGDDLRVKFVHAQASIEQVLSSALVLGEIKSLVGIIHTPQPATPLCTQTDNLDSQLLDVSIRYDLEKLLTVRERAVILRDYLEKGGWLYVAYPAGGLEKRSLAQQAVYKKELSNYNGHLIDAVLSCTAMDPDKVGATYFMRDQNELMYVFSIKAKQANDPVKNSEWGLWIGVIDDLHIKQRTVEILEYLEANDGPSLKRELNFSNP